MRKILIDVLNLTNSTINVNSLVYISGYVESQGLYTIGLASCDNPSAVPSVGILVETLSPGQVGLARIEGPQVGVNTSVYEINTPVYLGFNGQITYQNPIIYGDGYYVQEIGIVANSSQDGIILLQSSFANQFIANSNDGYVSGYGVINKIPYWFSPNTLSFIPSIQYDPTTGNIGFNTLTPTSTLTVNGDGYFSGNLVSDGYISADKIMLSQQSGMPQQIPGYGQIFIQEDGNLYFETGAGSFYQLTPPEGAGSVTSVGLALPSIFNVTGSPITGEGTLTATFVNQTDGYVFAAPVGVGSGTPLFRSIVSSDLNGSFTGITGLGTITTGVWEGVPLTSSYVPSISALNGLLSLNQISTLGAYDGYVVTYNGSSIIWASQTGTINGSGLNKEIAYWNGTSSLTGKSTFTFDGYNLISPNIFADGYIALQEGSAPINIPGFGTVYTKSSDHNLYFESSTGVITQLTPTSTGSVTGTGITHELAFWTGTSAISGNTNLTWDGYHFAVNNSSPNTTLSVVGDGYFSHALEVGYGIKSDGYLSAAGNFSLPINTISSTYFIGLNDYTVLCNAFSMSFTVTLPSPSGNSGKLFNIKKIDSTSNTITINTISGSIDGSSTKLLSSQYDSLTFQTDGSNWYII